jgi:hypothetical protein
VAPLALLVGRAAARLADGDPFRPGRRVQRAAAVVGLLLGAALAVGPYFLAREGEAHARSLVPAGAWALLVTLMFARRLGPDPAGALRLLRVGGAGFLLLLALALPPLLERRESGRRLFLPAQGREVLAFGAWRTAWMAGYFYNDGRVREVTELREVTDGLGSGPVLVVCGPEQRRQLEALLDLRTLVLAEGPRSNVLLRLERP